MQVNINPAYRRIRIATEETHERIKGRAWICIQQRVSQTRLADLTHGHVLTLVARVAETQFPVPRLEVIAKFSHLTFKSNIEQVIPVSELLTSGTGVLERTIPDASCHGDRDPIKKHGRICYCERIKRISNWHADTVRAKPYGTSGNLKRIGRKRSSRQRCIEKRACDLEIGKYGQVFLAQISDERAVDHLTVRRRKVWCESREVKEQVVSIARRTGSGDPVVLVYNAGYRKWIDIKWRGRSVRSRMRRRSVRAEEQPWDQTLVLHGTWFVAAAYVESSKRDKVPVAGNVAITAEQATGALIEIGDHHDIGLVIAGAGFQPRFPFTHIIGPSHVCISVAATDLQATELVNQEEVDHASHRIRSVHSRGAVLQDIDVIDH